MFDKQTSALAVDIGMGGDAALRRPVGAARRPYLFRAAAMTPPFPGATCRPNPKHGSVRPSQIRGGGAPPPYRTCIHPVNCELSKIRPFSQKPLFVSRCAATALNMNCGKLKAKNSPFFSGHFDRKSLAKWQRHGPLGGQKVSSKCRNFRGVAAPLAYSSATKDPIQGGGAPPPYHVHNGGQEQGQRPEICSFGEDFSPGLVLITAQNESGLFD
jgi:hypothetical protein